MRHTANFDPQGRWLNPTELLIGLENLPPLGAAADLGMTDLKDSAVLAKIYPAGRGRMRPLYVVNTLGEPDFEPELIVTQRSGDTVEWAARERHVAIAAGEVALFGRPDNSADTPLQYGPDTSRNHFFLGRTPAGIILQNLAPEQGTFLFSHEHQVVTLGAPVVNDPTTRQ